MGQSSVIELLLTYRPRGRTNDFIVHVFQRQVAVLYDIPVLVFSNARETCLFYIALNFPILCCLISKHR